MLLGELRQYALQFDEVRLLNRQVRVGDRWVAAAALARRGEAVCLCLLQNDPTYRARREEEPVPEIRALLQKDIEHLDAIQSSSASSREFVLVLPVEGQAVEDGSLRQMEKALCDHGIPVRLAEREDVKRLLAIYYQQSGPVEGWEDVDGERAVNGNG